MGGVALDRKRKTPSNVIGKMETYRGREESLSQSLGKLRKEVSRVKEIPIFSLMKTEVTGLTSNSEK